MIEKSVCVTLNLLVNGGFHTSPAQLPSMKTPQQHNTDFCLKSHTFFDHISDPFDRSKVQSMGSPLENLIRGADFYKFPNDAGKDPKALIEALNNIVGMLSSFTESSFYLQCQNHTWMFSSKVSHLPFGHVLGHRQPFDNIL